MWRLSTVLINAAPVAVPIGCGPTRLRAETDRFEAVVSALFVVPPVIIHFVARRALVVQMFLCS